MKCDFCAFFVVVVDSDIQKVLEEDREKLRLLQKSQPSFTEEQKKELMQVHPWMKKGGLPKVLEVKVRCVTQENHFEFARSDFGWIRTGDL